MTVIRPNSISGITSITAQANEINVFKSDGTLAGLSLNGVNVNTTSGISTYAALNVTGNVSVGGTLTYQDVTNVDAVGLITARAGVNVSGGQLDVGSNIKLGNAGVITATSFVGSGANLTGISQVGGSTGVDFNDNVKIRLGTGNDLEIYHDGSDSIIQGGDPTVIRSNLLLLKNFDNSESYIRCYNNGSVELYHNNSKKFNTHSSGIHVSGGINLGASSGTDPVINNADGGGGTNLYFNTNGSARLIIQSDGHTRPASNNTYDLGTSGDRWRNIYSADLQLSNKGSANEVDGTWGDYTIQEGESDLFLINRRSGKKYKFNLTEVS